MNKRNLLCSALFVGMFTATQPVGAVAAEIGPGNGYLVVVGGSMQDELLLYVIHGTLHLVGLDDKSPSGAAEMRLAEKKYLAESGVEHRWLEVESGQDDREGNS